MESKDKQLLQQIKTLHSQIQNDSKQSLQRALKLGSILLAQKKRVGYGNFINWIKKYLPFSERTSRNYLTLHKNKEKIKEAKVSSLSEAYQLFRTKLPYSVFKNNFYENEKNSTIYTPQKVSEYLYSVLSPAVSPSVILDPAIGKGSLTNLFREEGTTVIGIDIDSVGEKYSDVFIHSKFEEIDNWEYEEPDFIIANPPFNGYAKKMYPEIFIRKIVELWGEKKKIVMVVPMGFRLNATLRSERWNWLKNSKLKITSIISLPINIFGTKFHTEIICFNIPKLKPHYFLYE